MLGLIKSVSQSSSWMWAAYGKHPAVKDYFRVGQDFPLLRVFAGWVENGYKQYSLHQDDVMQNAWYFWARGASGESIVCGLIKDSTDGLGRNYPFLMIGAGPLPKWEENWDLLPLACSGVWGEIDDLLAQNFDDLKQLETQVRRIGQPESGWQELKSKVDLFPDHSERLQNVTPLLHGNQESFIPLGQDLHQDRYSLFSHCHSLFKSNVRIIPNVVFLGESLGRYFVKFNTRPLTPTDFVHLWNAGRGMDGV